MLEITIDPRSDVPPSRQLVEAVLDAIARGALVAGDRLPSVRVLAASALVNPNTVGKAYRDLEVLGAVDGRNGSGVYVTEHGPELARQSRQQATRERFLAAAVGALRAGHEIAELEDLLAAAGRAEDGVSQARSSGRGNGIARRDSQLDNEARRRRA